MDVVFEIAGGRVFDESIEALAPFGRIVVNGIATREQNEVRTGRLLRKSWSVVGFWLMHCLGRRDMMEEPLADLFERAARGELRADRRDHLSALRSPPRARRPRRPAHAGQAPARPLLLDGQLSVSYGSRSRSSRR